MIAEMKSLKRFYYEVEEIFLKKENRKTQRWKVREKYKAIRWSVQEV